MSPAVRLYIANATLLIAHEIDSAYWHEWRLLGIPGGIQLFVLLHLPLLAVVLYGLVRLVRGDRAGHGFALLLAAAGVFAFALHGALLLAGHAEFRLPVSLLLLAAILLASLAQGVAAVRALRR